MGQGPGLCVARAGREQLAAAAAAAPLISYPLPSLDPTTQVHQDLHQLVQTHQRNGDLSGQLNKRSHTSRRRPGLKALPALQCNAYIALHCESDILQLPDIIWSLD